MLFARFFDPLHDFLIIGIFDFSKPLIVFVIVNGFILYYEYKNNPY